MLTVDVLERFPESLERWQNAFRYVLVDEYQDTNHAQYRLLQLLSGQHRNVFAVGDPDQSIYSFRSADIRNILDFEVDFPEAQTIALEQNYRSTNSILESANHVISHNRERKPKNLWSELGEGEPVRVIEVEDEHAEARFVAAQIAQLVEQGLAGSEIAVFYRTNAQSRVLEDVLVRQQVPYQVIGGPKFYERAEIKDLIAYLQVIDNPAVPTAPREQYRHERKGGQDLSDENNYAENCRVPGRVDRHDPVHKSKGGGQRINHDSRTAQCAKIQGRTGIADRVLLHGPFPQAESQDDPSPEKENCPRDEGGALR